MTDFNEKFKEKCGDYPYVRFVSAKVDSEHFKVTLGAVYKQEREKDFLKARAHITEIARSLLPPSADVALVASPVIFSSGEIMRGISEFFGKQSALVFSAITKENTVISTGDKPAVFIGLPESVAAYVAENGLDAMLKEYLDSRFFTDFSLKISSRAENDDEIRQVLNATTYRPKFSYARPDEGRRIDPKDRRAVCGDAITGTAGYIVDCIQPEFAVLYGQVSDARIREYTPKKAENDEQKRKFVTFSLDDGTGKIRCVFFPGAKSESAAESVRDGIYVIADGYLDFDARAGDGTLQFRLRRFSTCSRAEFEINEVVRLVDDDYRYVRPAPYTALSQSYMYGEVKKPLTTEPLVVFSVLTTSQNKYAPGEMIEIGAVKLIDGKITETFSSLIRPSVEMSEEARLAAGVLASEFTGKPTFDQVVPDFYKFFNGFTLTGFPVDWHIYVLRPYLEKLHIPEPPLAEITKYADASKFKEARPKNTRRALPFAEAYAKILANI